ncbi:MAG: hypothetical protein E8D45_05820, partial [Nitrospira sp.]
MRELSHPSVGAVTAHVGAGSSFRNAAANLGLVMLSLLMVAVLGEITLRALAPQPIIPRYVESAPYGIRKNIGHVRGEMMVAEYRHGFSTNSQGFRGTREYAVVKPPGVFRIVALGDSTTLGHGVEDDETFSAVLERQLSASRPTEVLNMGVSGFGTAEELIQLREVGLRYQPDLVVLGYWPNDPYNNVVSRLFRVEGGAAVRESQDFVPAIAIRDRLYSIPGYSFLCQHSHLVNFVRNRVSAYFVKSLAEEHRISFDVEETVSLKERELTGALLQALAVETAERSIPLVILNMPVLTDGRRVANFPRDIETSLPATVSVVDVGTAIYRARPPGALSYAKD